MTLAEENPGCNRFLQGCGVVLTLAFAVLSIRNEPAFIRAELFNLWHIVGAVIVLSFLAVFVFFRDGGIMAFASLILGTLAAAFEALFIKDEMDGVVQAFATLAMLVASVASLALSIRDWRYRSKPG